MKILVIPSWFPESASPWKGTFFEEQAAVASENWEVASLRVHFNTTGRRQLGSWTGLYFGGPRLHSFELLPTHNRHLLFNAEVGIAAASPETTLDFKTRGFLKAYDRFVQTVWKPDLIHAHCAIEAGWFASAVYKAFGTPYVLTEHQHIIFDYFSHEDWRRAMITYDLAKRVAVVSGFQKQMLMMNGVETSPLVIGNYVDDRHFVLPSHPLVAPLCQILFVGTTSRLKGYGALLSALQILKRQWPKPFVAKLVCPDFIQGDQERLRCLIESHDLGDVVQLTPSATRQEILHLIHQSEVFVSTSIAETFGVALCEALMCGCPVVATSSGGVSDFVIDGFNGYLVPVGDAERVEARIADVFAGSLITPPTEIRGTVLSKYGREGFLTRLRHLYQPE